MIIKERILEIFDGRFNSVIEKEDLGRYSVFFRILDLVSNSLGINI